MRTSQNSNSINKKEILTIEKYEKKLIQVLDGKYLIVYIIN